MSLAQIRYFIAVADAGNVGRAAIALHVAQPAVSRQIRLLESELETPLFVRTARGMTLSRAGRVFLEHARAIVARLRDAEAAVRGMVPAAPSDRDRPAEIPHPARDPEREGGGVHDDSGHERRAREA